MLVLGVESSCDETAFAVVEDGKRVLSNAIGSQIELHKRFGGVVPEIASRAHLEATVPLYEKALADAGVTIADIDLLAATQGPGLSGCLLVGLEFAKATAFSHGKPIVGVHHIAGHLYSPQLAKEKDAWGNTSEDAAFQPYLALVISGGHSSLIHVTAPTEFSILGETIDDAVGEAYDKVAKLVGLGYPGGPILDQMAADGDLNAFALPRPILDQDNYNFSFSGLKTAVARLVEQNGKMELKQTFVNDVAACFQEACIDVLLTKAKKAAENLGTKRIAFTGGVACNKGLRKAATERLPGYQLAFPLPEFCTDNAAMIAGIGYHFFENRESAGLSLNAAPSLSLT